MLDKLKIRIENFIATGTKNWKYRGSGLYPGQKIYTLKIYNPNATKKRFAIQLCKIVNIDTGEEFIMFENSIRKWYFGRNTRQDLKYFQYVDCIKILSREIGVREIDLWNARVMTLEMGINLLLKSNMKNVNECLIRYRGLKRVTILSSVYFEGKNLKLRIYDKWAEIFRSKKMNIYQLRFASKYHLLRVEVEVKKMTGFFQAKAFTLGNVKDNWNEIVSKLEWYIKGINFVDRISPAISKNEIKTPTDFYGYHLYENMNKDFFRNLRQFEKLTFSQNNKSGSIKNLLSLFERGVSKIADFKQEFYSTVYQKTGRLYNKGNL
ncbi:hypothetical protein [Flavobacterium suzhouense]|uniref:Replication initiation factor n=1 Tax=Flavobacterium suzhouense TaxID=1529638 RepID=A0ABW5NTV4_9FLAO